MHRDLAPERGQRVGVAGRFSATITPMRPCPSTDRAMHVMADRATGDMQAVARRSEMFSPIVAIALAIASATVPPWDNGALDGLRPDGGGPCRARPP